MKNRLPYFVLLLFLLSITLVAVAGNPTPVKWVVKNPFEQKVFIENRGQYEIENKLASKDILYAARQGGLQYYFTANSIWIKRMVSIKNTKQEMESLKEQISESENKGDKDNEKQLAYKYVDEFHEISFMGANSAAEITTDNEVSWYYSFTIGGNEPVKAHAFKKLIYHNLYPGIDMEFYFPEGKQGFEYSFIVHPGADITQIKIQYPLNEGLKITDNGNVTIKSAFGEFTDHKPVAFSQGLESESVSCVFTLKQGIIQFSIGSYNNKNNLVIDPWTATPTFSGINNGYDVDWDNAGNCYVYGGSFPWQLEKLDPNGNLLWLFTTSFPINSSYGGFAVDRYSQSVYIIQGFNPNGGADVIKLNSSGIAIKAFIGAVMNEMWRIAFAHCSNQAVIGAGGTTAAYQGCYLDTNLVNLTPVNVLNEKTYFHDIWGLALDNYGYCYMIAARTAGIAPPYGNTMVKLPLPALTPTQWTVQSGYDLIEASSVSYTGRAGGGTGDGNGYDGVTISDSNLYTYDGYILKKWSTSTGQMLNSTIVNSQYNNISPITGDTLISWGGLTSNECGNIFVGSGKNIIQFDEYLTAVNTINGTDTVYDIMLGNNNILYACGVNFVEAIQLSLPICNPITVKNQINNPNCITSLGSVIAIIEGESPSYTISWNTTPVQTGDTAKNLSAGTYIATITSCPLTIYDTVQILPAPIVPKVTVDSPTTCLGKPVNLTANGASTYTWSPSTGLNTTTGDSLIGSPTITTTYTVVGTLNGDCSDTAKSVVAVNSLPVLELTPAIPSICLGQGISWSASGALTYTWSPSTGLSATTGNSVTLNPTSTITYSITGIDSLGCSNMITAIASVDSLPSASFIIDPPSLCNTQDIRLTNTSIGANAYEWNFGDGTTDNGINPAHSYKAAGVYTINLVATTANGCTDSTGVVDTIKSVNYGVHIGNAFTPGDADNGNNIFKPEQILCSASQNYTFRIYSRWGELLYETNDPTQGWDGTYKGKMEPMDVYVYYIQYACGPCTQFIKGNVTLLK